MNTFIYYTKTKSQKVNRIDSKRGRIILGEDALEMSRERVVGMQVRRGVCRVVLDDTRREELKQEIPITILPF